MGQTKHIERSVVIMAVGGALRVDALRRGVEAALKRAGWVERPTPAPTDGELLRASTYERGGRAWAVLDGGSHSLVSIGRDAAQACRATLVIHEAAAHDRARPPTKGSDPGYDVQLRSFDVTANGDLRPLPDPAPDSGSTGASPPSTAAAEGTLDAAAELSLWRLVDPTGGGGDRKWTSALWRPAPPSPDMPRRLVELARVIELTGSWTIERQGDRWLVRVESPTLGKRMSALTDEDLALLRQTVAIAPTVS